MSPKDDTATEGAAENALPVEQVEIPLENLERIFSQIQHRSYSGPLPPSEEFEKYGAILSSAPERILAMAEKEQAFRHEWRPRFTRYELIEKIFGIIAGIAALGSLIGGAVYCALQGHDSVAMALVSAAAIGGIAQVAAIFTRGK